MADYDLVIRGGTVVTAGDTYRADVGVRGGRIAAIGEKLDGTDTLDAGGLYVMPGGVDTHCHIEQLRPNGRADEESFVTGSTACLAGGTTSVITFAAQFKGHGIRDTLAEYHRRAKQAMVDYSFHQIITDPSDSRRARRDPRGGGIGCAQPEGVPDLRAVASRRSRIHPRPGSRAPHRGAGDGALRELRGHSLAHGCADGGWSQCAEIPRLVAAQGGGARGDLSCDCPCRNGGSADPGVPRLVFRGGRGDRPCAGTRPEGLGRDLSAVLCAWRRRHGSAGLRGRQVHVQPEPARRRHQRGSMGDVRRGTLDIVSSDHSGASYEGEQGKRIHGNNAPFPDIPNGVPGLAARLPLVFSEGVAKGRIDLNTYVRLISTNPAKLFGLYPRKGTIAPGIGCRSGAVGPGQARHHHQCADAACDRLHAVRRHGGDRLAGRHREGRTRGDAGWQGTGRAGDGSVPATRSLSHDQADRDIA